MKRLEELEKEGASPQEEIMGAVEAQLDEHQVITEGLTVALMDEKIRIRDERYWTGNIYWKEREWEVGLYQVSF
jgi:hypothetical protein